MWWRNEELVQEDSNHTTSQFIVDTLAYTIYENTLRVRGREGGQYSCTVSNNIRDFVSELRSSAVDSVNVEGNNLVRFLIQHLSSY